MTLITICEVALKSRNTLLSILSIKFKWIWRWIISYNIDFVALESITTITRLSHDEIQTTMTRLSHLCYVSQFWIKNYENIIRINRGFASIILFNPYYLVFSAGCNFLNLDHCSPPSHPRQDFLEILYWYRMVIEAYMPRVPKFPPCPSPPYIHALAISTPIFLHSVPTNHAALLPLQKSAIAQSPPFIDLYPSERATISYVPRRRASAVPWSIPATTFYSIS